jgi:proline iminopeptidase
MWQKKIFSSGLFLALVLFLGTVQGKAAKLYMKAWGNPAHPAVIFLHGGPGYNSASFELTTAAQLADRNFYVITYDQRGAARSKDVKAVYTFPSYCKDLLRVYKHFGVKRAILIGHSFGGPLALHFAAAYPEKVDAIALVSAPVRFPAVFDAIRARCREVYTAKNSPDLRYIDILDTMDRSRLDYATYCFAHALACGLYSPKDPTPAYKAIYQHALKDPDAKYLLESTIPPVKGFYNSERYTTQDYSALLKTVLARTPLVGIYGDEDGLFDTASLKELEGWIGKDRFHLLQGASHSVFVDQQQQFLEIMEDLRVPIPVQTW